jgi:hypothetical protein
VRDLSLRPGGARGRRAPWGDWGGEGEALVALRSGHRFTRSVGRVVRQVRGQGLGCDVSEASSAICGGSKLSTVPGQLAASAARLAVLSTTSPFRADQGRVVGLRSQARHYLSICQRVMSLLQLHILGGQFTPRPGPLTPPSGLG